MTQIPIILASASPYKRQQLQQICDDFICQAADIDETPLANESARELSIRLAVEKAQGVSARNKQAIVIGCDQSAELEGELIGKAGNFENASLQLRRCSGKQCTFYSAVTIIANDGSPPLTKVSTTEVVFRVLSNEEIQTYLLKDTPFDCAGSFKVESRGISLFERVSSDDPSALIGLPLIALNHVLLDLA